MEIHIKGSTKEIADLIEMIRGRQEADVKLNFDGRDLAKSVLEATSRGTSADTAG